MASLVANQMYDTISLQTGVPSDLANANLRSFKMLEKALDANLGMADAPSRKSTKSISDSSTSEKKQTKKVTKKETEDEEESVLNKAHKDIKSKSHHTEQKIVKEHTVTKEDFTKK